MYALVIFLLASLSLAKLGGDLSPKEVVAIKGMWRAAADQGHRRRVFLYHDDCHGDDGLGVSVNYVKVGLWLAEELNLTYVPDPDQFTCSQRKTRYHQFFDLGSAPITTDTVFPDDAGAEAEAAADAGSTGEAVVSREQLLGGPGLGSQAGSQRRAPEVRWFCMGGGMFRSFRQNPNTGERHRAKLLTKGGQASTINGDPGWGHRYYPPGGKWFPPKSAEGDAVAAAAPQCEECRDGELVGDCITRKGASHAPLAPSQHTLTGGLHRPQSAERRRPKQPATARQQRLY
jgi:hypothetical protein